MEVKGIEIAISDVKDVSLKEVADSDVLLIGSPNHVGKPARGIEAFIDKLGKIDLKTNWVRCFRHSYGLKTIARMPRWKRG